MESANLYDHNNHHHLLYTSSSSSSSSSPSLGVSALHDWKWNNNPSSSIILDGYDEELKKYMTEILPNSIKSSTTTTTTTATTLQEIQFENDEMNYNFLKLSDDVMMNSYYHHHHHHDDKLSLFLGGGNYSSNSFTIPKQINNGESFGYNNNNCKMEGSNKYQSFEERNSFNHFFQLQQSTTHIPSTTSNKTSKFRNVNQKLSAAADSNHQQIAVAKRPRLSSSPTLKVRKEKLGDRIAAIHRMVSPFGKTDTASVLTEAIGYIQFLQDQIQTLTMSYLKSSRSKSRRNARGDSTMKDDHHNRNQHQKLEDDQKTYEDLRSRGLCLVPLSFTSYICSYNGNI